MNIKTRIAKFLITLTTFSVMTTVNAYQGNNCCDPCCNYNPCCPQSNRSFFVGVDYIYWSVHQDGLIISDTFLSNGSSCDCSCDCDDEGDDNNCQRDFDRDWNSGFKIGVGFANPCCDWELFVQYTWYQANPHRRHHGNNLWNSWGFISPDAIVTEARGNWKLNFNNVDFLITNEFCVNNCFTFRPAFGLKGAWITQHFRPHFFFEEFESEFNFLEIKHRQQFWAVGPKFAITASASLFDCFNLYGNLGVSSIWGQFRNRRNDFFNVVTIENGTETFGNPVAFCAPRHCRYRVTPVVETTFGARWDTDLCCGDYGFYAQVAWEQQIWFDHNDFINFDVNHSHGNLTFQGVTAGVGFSF